MLHSLGTAASDMPPHVMQAMFAARKSVFIDLLKWDVPVLAGRYEIDQFDDEHAHYLVLADGDGMHLGSARLLPTERPHILNSLYPQLCENAAPQGPDIFEITRFCLDRRMNARDRRIVRDTLVTALAEHALACGVTRYTAIAEIKWLQQILAFGWRCRPLGLPVQVGSTVLGALLIEIDTGTPAQLARAGIRAAADLIDGSARAAA